MKIRILSTLFTLLLPIGILAQNAEFETAAEAVKNMKVGWNLVNTLDVAPPDREGIIYDPSNYESYETGWGNPKTKPELMKMIRKAGFNAIRVPVTWFPYTDANGNVDSRWMKRVHEVVDYVIDQGMYCLLNVHHDTGEHEAVWIRADQENYQKNHQRYENLWRQIAEEFKDYDEHLLFEGYNEMLNERNQWGEPIWGVSEEEWQADYDALNSYAQSFVNSVRRTGGNNLFRNLVVNTYAAAISDISIENLKIPENVVDNHIAFQIHYYPNRNTLTEEEIDEIIEKWDKGVNSKGVPLIVGEWQIMYEGITDKEFSQKLISLSRCFIEKTKARDMATFGWEGIVSYGSYRDLPAIINADYVRAIMKGYYGDWYEPTLITKDDYVCLGVNVSYDYQWAELIIYNEEIDLNEYKGIRVEIEKADEVMVKVYGESEGKEQYCGMSSVSETFTFNKSALGNKVTMITLQNTKGGKNDTKLLTN